MKILFVLPYVPSLIRVRSYHFVRELARDHEVTVLATDAPDALVSATDVQRWCRHVEVVPFRRTRALVSCGQAALRGDPLQAGVCWSAEWAGRLRDLVERQAFDVVHVEHLRAARLCDAVPEQVPVVYDSVDCISHLLERTLRSSHSLAQRVISALELRRTRAFEARTLCRVDQVAVTSPVDARALQALAPSARITVVPNGVDIDYFRPLPGPRQPATLVLSGKMSYHANVTAALAFTRETLPLVRRARPDVQVRIVGSRPPRSIERLAADPGMTITGYVPDMREAIGDATVAICPTRVKAGIQNKVLEAMALGLPVVSTREGVEGLEAIPGQDLLVADTPQEFADHVARLLADPALQRAIGMAGRHYVETHHRWEAEARRLEETYLAARQRQTASVPA